jgi:hypothetical protein
MDTPVVDPQSMAQMEQLTAEMAAVAVARETL